MSSQCLKLKSDIIQSAVAEAVVQDEYGSIVRIPAGAKNHFEVELAVEIAELRPGCWQISGVIRNNGKKPLVLREVVPLSVAAEWGGRLEFGSLPSGWTVFGLSNTVSDGGGVYDLGVWRYDALKNNFFTADYMVIGDRKNAKYLTAGWLEFGRQHGVFRLQFDESVYGLEYWRAIVEFDRYPLPPGAAVKVAPLYVNTTDKPAQALDEYTALVAENQHVPPQRVNRVATGWGTWDYYHAHITEDDVLENARWLAEHRDLLPVEYIQLDHGFQPCEGDWLETNSCFPHGLAWLAQEIKKLGFKPAIWLCPFLIAEESRVYRAHPDWVIRDAAGRPVVVSGYAKKHVYILDCSIPAARAWVRELGQKIRAYGYEYVKLDGANVQTMSPAGVLADPQITKIQAMRMGLEALRAGLGEETFLLSAALFGASAGVVDAMRIGGDVGARWDCRHIDKHHGERDRYPGPGYIRRCVGAAMNCAFLHRRWWCNDPDYLVVRPAGDRSELSEAEAITWASVVGLTNGLVILSDRMSTLPPERLAILSKVLPPYVRGARTLDFFEQEFPAFLHLPVENAGEKWHVVGIINAHPIARARNYRVDFERCGLPADSVCHVFDFWAGAYLGQHRGAFEVVALPSGHCRVLGIRPVQDIPQLVGNDLHITQGGVEYAAAFYDADRRALVCRGARLRRSGRFFVYLPETYRQPDAATAPVVALQVNLMPDQPEVVLPLPCHRL